MKKRDFAVIGCVLAIALIAAAVARSIRSPAGYAHIYLDGALYRTVPLDHEEDVVIRQPGGEENLVAVSPNGVYMKAANCPHQTCVRQGTLTKANCHAALSNNWIVCLPNGVSVEVVWEETP